MRLILWGAIALLIIVVAASVVWFQRQIVVQTQDLLAESERQSNINLAQTVRVQSQLALARNAECSLALSLKAYDLAATITDFPPYDFQNSVRDALQATRTEQVLPAHTSLNAVAWSQDGRTLAAGGSEGGTQIWEATEAGFQKTTLIPAPGQVGSLAFSPNDNLLAIGSIEIVLWDLAKNATAVTLRGHSQKVRVLAWHPDGRWLASGSDDGTVIIWDTQKQTAVQTLTQHQQDDGTDYILGLAWSPDGAWLASAGFDNNIRLWDASGLADDAPTNGAVTLKETWLVNDQGSAVRLAWSPDGTQLAVSYPAGMIQIWNVDSKTSFTGNPKPAQTLVAHTGTVWGLAWSPDGAHLASSADDQTVRIWVGQPLKLLATFSGHIDSVTGGVAWNADGTALVSASSDQTVRVWRLTPRGIAFQQVDGFLLDAKWQPDPKQKVAALAIASTTNGHLIRLWDIDTNVTDTVTTTHHDSIIHVAWSSDGKQLATASLDTEGHVYDAQSGERLHRLTDHTDPVYDVAWSPNGQQLVTAANDGSVRLWKLSDETSEHFLASNSLNSISWQPDGAHFAAGASNGLVNVWDVTTGQRYDWTGQGSTVLAIAWHPDGRWLASGGQDGQIIIWDTATDDWTTGHIWKQDFDLGEQIWDLAWQGNLLAASGVNGSVKVWDVVTGATVANYGGHQGAVRAVNWSPDGCHLVTVGQTDGTALVHYANFADDLLPLARRQLERGSREVDRERCLAASSAN